MDGMKITGALIVGGAIGLALPNLVGLSAGAAAASAPKVIALGISTLIGAAIGGIYAASIARYTDDDLLDYASAGGRIAFVACVITCLIV